MVTGAAQVPEPSAAERATARASDELLRDALGADGKGTGKHVHFGHIQDAQDAHAERQVDLQDHNQTMVATAVELRKDTKSALDGIERELAKAEEEMIDASNVAARGHDTIREINARLDEIAELNTSARHNIMVIVRNLCKDKCMTILIIAVLVGVSIVGALLVRQTLVDSRQSGTTTVVVQATPAPTPA